MIGRDRTSSVHHIVKIPTPMMPTAREEADIEKAGIIIGQSDFLICNFTVAEATEVSSSDHSVYVLDSSDSVEASYTKRCVPAANGSSSLKSK